jgi:hypothetical protein
VAEHDDEPAPEAVHAELEAPRDLGRHDVARDAHHVELARRLVEDRLRDDALVGARPPRSAAAPAAAARRRSSVPAKNWISFISRFQVLLTVDR